MLNMKLLDKAVEYLSLKHEARDEQNSAFHAGNRYQSCLIQNISILGRSIGDCHYIIKKGRITNRKYREINGIKVRLASSELKEMVDKNILDQIGLTGRGTYYVFK